MGPLLEGRWPQARPQAEAKGLTLAAEPCGAAARFDRKWTAEALFNVVDNAVKYTPAGGRVTLSAVPWGSSAGWTCPTPASASQREEQGADLRPLLPGRRCAGGREGWASASTWSGGDPAAAGGYVKVASRPGQGTTFPSTCPGIGRIFPNCKI